MAKAESNLLSTLSVPQFMKYMGFGLRGDVAQSEQSLDGSMLSRASSNLLHQSVHSSPFYMEYTWFIFQLLFMHQKQYAD